MLTGGKLRPIINPVINVSSTALLHTQGVLKVHSRRFNKLAVEQLEDRRVPAAFAESPVIHSVNGVLTTTLVATTGPVVLDPTGYNGFDAVGGTMIGGATTYQVQGSTRGLFPGPTLQANPGDTLDITIVNNISSAAGSAVGPTNFHTHGLHVSSLGNTDNVFLQIEQLSENHFRIHIPTNEPEGLYWYHPHVHMLTNPQVWAGLAGLIVIGDPDGGAPELAGLTEHNMAIRSFQTAVDPTTGATNLVDVSATSNLALNQFAVNGQLNPTLDISPGETQVWNVANVSNGNFLSLVVKDMTTGANLPLYVVAQDGQPLTVPKLVNTIDVPDGRRFSFMVQIPAGTAPGTRFELQSIPYYAGFTQWPLGNATDSVTLATAVVNSTPVTPFAVPTQLTPPNDLFNDLRTATMAEQRTLVFDQGPVTGGFAFVINGQQFPNGALIQPRIGTSEEWTITNDTDDTHPFHIHQNNFQVISVNGVPIDPNGDPVTLDVNYPTGAPPQKETYIGGGLNDTVDIPAENPTTGEPGKVVIRMQFRTFLGSYVYHCHILAHEDMGMMGTVNVAPDHPYYAIGQNPGQPTTVKVFDASTTKQVAQFYPFSPTDTQGVNVAAGDVNGDGVFDIIVGHKGDTRVIVIDGTKLNQISANGVIAHSALLADFYAFTTDRQGGVSVAAGDINGDGLADVIVGAGAGTDARVRVVDATKLHDVNASREIQPSALLAKFLAFSANFKGGVSVAAGDTDGNGRIDVIVGSGAGRRAMVKDIDGTMLDQVDSNGLIMTSALHTVILPFDNTYNQGVTVGTGNLKGFAFNDIVIGAAAGQPPKVAVYNLPDHAPADPMQMMVAEKSSEFFAYQSTDLSGVNVSSFWNAANDVLLATPQSGNEQVRKTFRVTTPPPPVIPMPPMM